MPVGSIANEATNLARRTLVLALGGLVLLGALSFLALGYLDSVNKANTERLMRAQGATGTIALADEWLTMSANMAAASGEQRWIDRYYAEIPVIDAAIAEAASLASPEVAARFDAETRAANDRLVAMEEASFEAVRAGDLAEARGILDSHAYAVDKRILDQGTDRFLEAVVAGTRAELSAVQRGAQFMLPVLALLVVGAAVFLWRRLRETLKGSETAIHDAECVIRDLARTDALTGMANRRELREHLRATLQRADRSRAKLALLTLDLDEFKQINNRHGNVVGDLVLKEVSRRLAGVLRQGEYVARNGGDEFVVIVEFASEATVRRLAQRLIEVLCQPMAFDGVEVRAGASIGIAFFPTVARGEEDLLRKSDLALRRAKRDGRGAVRVYDLTMDVEINDRIELENDLRAAVVSGAVAPHFQPIVDLRTGAITGFEILSRWRHPTRGYVQPSEFVPIAETIGVIRELTVSVLRAACAAARCMPAHITLSLNVAPQQIQEDWLAEKVIAILAETGFSPQRLVIEVSENALVADLAAARRVITALKAHGVRVALDDFGSGYSSLTYLSELPFDAVKIDSGFVRAICERAESAKIVSAIVGLSRSLGVVTIAESVETEAQADFLRTIGCDAAQGYFFYKPMPAAEAALALAPKPEDMADRAIA